MDNKQIKSNNSPSFSNDLGQRWAWRGMLQGRWVVLIVAAFMLFFASCVGEEDVDVYKNESPLAIASATLINNSANGIQKRAATTLTSGSLGIFRLAGTGYLGTMENIQYSYISSNWEAASTPIYMNKNTASLRAYYPYSSDAVYNTGTAVPLTSQLYASSKDLCYQKTSVSASSSTQAAFALDHAYAKINLKLKRIATYAGSCTIDQIKISNSALCSTNTINLTTGTYGTPTISGSVTVNPAINSIAIGDSTTAEILMVPVTSLFGKVVFSIRVDNETLVTSLAATASNNLSSIEAGKNYNITATISGASLNITSVSTTDWTEVSTGTYNTVKIADEANCYIVPLGESVYIPVSRAVAGQIAVGNSSFTLPTTGTAGLLWTDNSNGLSETGSVQSISYNKEGKYIKVTAGSAEGNSVIALYDNNGTTIRWSWHIWVTNYNPNVPSNGTTYNFNASNPLTFMDRNLGATTSTAGNVAVNGLFYQWGRKDPFPSSTTLDGSTEPTIYDAAGASFTCMEDETPIQSMEVSAELNLGNSILNPGTFYEGTSSNSLDWYSVNDFTHNDSLWGGASTITPTDKTIFDPCPVGWRVAPSRNSVSPWSTFATYDYKYNGGSWSASDYGATWINAGFYPGSGYRDSSTGAIYGVGDIGTNWSASPYLKSGTYIRFHPTDEVVTKSSGNRAFGMPVRCVQEF